MKHICKTNFKSQGKFWKKGEEFIGDKIAELTDHGMIEPMPCKDEKAPEGELDENIEPALDGEDDHEEEMPVDGDLQPPAGLKGKALKKWKKEHAKE